MAEYVLQLQKQVPSIDEGILHVNRSLIFILCRNHTLLNITNNTLEIKALTVFASFCILLTEAEYAFQLRKKIVPLMMEETYKPDGWLGILLGTKYYMDFSGRLRFEDEALKLINEISDCSHATVDEEGKMEEMGNRENTLD